ncbi:MAG: pyrimidine 5'-nucleotidase [Rhodospirillaceae bacterium]|nr:pyrimidine 5'-nucleotidase [Rhodospirillaceae bacterium]
MEPKWCLKKMENQEEQIFTNVKSINYWVFDLDNTIYRSNTNLFLQVEKKIGTFVANYLNIEIKDAKIIQKNFFYKYKSTLNGMISEYNINPESFLDYVHDIDYSILKNDEKFNDLLSKLPGNKYIYTNGSTKHALNVLESLGITEQFSGIFDIQNAKYKPKPDLETMKTFLEKFSIKPSNALMAEDMPINLKPAHTLGLKTLLIETEYNWQKEKNLNYIDFKSDDLQKWLKKIINNVFDK